MVQNRGRFNSRIGIVLATAGSAVGLGNIWRFPYMTGQDGGAAFILLYIAFTLMLGIPGMIAEFVVGRHSSANASRAYSMMSGRRSWGVIGLLGVVTSMIILGFYAVVAGWCLQYLFVSIAGGIHGDVTYVERYFTEFSSDAVLPTVLTVVFIVLTHLVVTRGVRRGIERVSKILMPTLFILLLIIVAASCSLPGSWRGVTFLFHPDFSVINHSIMLDALGQSFFSLSLGTACLCTYASYFNRETNLVKSAVSIASIDTVIAILAGLMIFPAAYSVGVNPDSGPALIFVTLPNVFQQAFGNIPAVGYAISIMFYALLSLAALTSTRSMHEIGTAYIYEEFGLSRKSGAWIETVVCCVIGVFCSLSMGAVDSLKIAGMRVLDFCDYITAQIMLPLGALLTCLFVGWVVKKQTVSDEFTNNGTSNRIFFSLWMFAVRVICPLSIIAIFLHQLGII